jgi:hypothetical protein
MGIRKRVEGRLDGGRHGAQGAGAGGRAERRPGRAAGIPRQRRTPWSNLGRALAKGEGAPASWKLEAGWGREERPALEEMGAEQGTCVQHMEEVEGAEAG